MPEPEVNPAESVDQEGPVAPDVVPDDEGEKSKTDIVGWIGGLPVKLSRKMESGKTLREELEKHIGDLLQQELDNQQAFIDKIPTWNRQYRGIKPTKSTPWENCANVAVPVTRAYTDSILVRVVDSIFSKRKVYTVKAKKAELMERAREIEEGFDWFIKKVLKLKKKVLFPLIQATKIGVGYAKVVNEEKNRTIYRYATPEERKDKSIIKYDLEGTDAKAVKETKTTYKGPNVYPVDRADWVMSSEVADIQDAYICGFRTDFRKADLDLRVRRDIMDEDAVKKITVCPDDFTDQKIERDADADKENTKEGLSQTYAIWELWTKYDVDEDGEEDYIVLLYHLPTRTIAKAIYTPLFTGQYPFVKWTLYPTEYSSDGEGTCQTLESIHEEIDTMHNQRIDRITEINLPMIFYRLGCGIEGKPTTEPGKWFGVEDDPSKVVKEVLFHDTTPSSFTEEDRLMSLAQLATGNTPAVMGMPTAERPVARDTQSQVEETNKKFKYGHENVREGFIDLGYMLLEFFAQYMPKFTYTKTINGKVTEQTMELPLGDIREMFDLDLMVSNDLNSQSTRREGNMTVYSLLSDYMTKVYGMAQMIEGPEVPSDLKRVLLDACEKSGKIVNRIVEDFDVPDADELVIKVEKIIDVEKALATSPDMAQPQPPAPPGGPPAPGGPTGPQGPKPPIPPQPPAPVGP